MDGDADGPCRSVERESIVTLLGLGAAVCLAVLLVPWTARRRLRRLLRTTPARPDAAAPATSEPDATSPALVLDLVAVALESGLDPASAVAAAGRSLGSTVDPVADIETIVASLARMTREDDVAAELRAALEFSAATGAPAAELLRSRADDLRRRRLRRAEEAAGRLGVRIVLPLGVCILPAFIALGVMPVVLSLVEQFAEIY